MQYVQSAPLNLRKSSRFPQCHTRMPMRYPLRFESIDHWLLKAIGARGDAQDLFIVITQRIRCI